MKQIEKLLIKEFKKNNVNFDNNFRYDYVDDSFTDVLKSVIGVVKKLNYIPCCKSDSEQLRDKWDITFEQWIELYYEEYSPTQVISKEGIISYKTDLEKMFYKLRNP